MRLQSGTDMHGAGAHTGAHPRLSTIFPCTSHFRSVIVGRTLRTRTVVLVVISVSTSVIVVSRWL